MRTNSKIIILIFLFLLFNSCLLSQSISSMNLSLSSLTYLDTTNQNNTDSQKVSVGISGTYYYTANNGTVVGMSGMINYHLNKISAVAGIIRIGKSAPVIGAVEHRSEWDDDINSLTEITFLYRHNIPVILNGIFICSGVSYLFGNREDDTKYDYLSLPLVLVKEFQMTESLYFILEINGYINNKLNLWGFDVGVSYNF